MATSTLSLEPALTALQTPGFCYEANSGIGERASQPFEDIDTEAGLNFYEENFIKNERIAGILRSSKCCNLIAYRKFASDAKRIFQFRAGGMEADRILVVLLWPPCSEPVFYSDSWKHDLPVVGSDNGLWRVPQGSANLAGCGNGNSIYLENGGLTVHDGRTLVKFACGEPIAASFASDDFIRKWRTKKKPVLTTEDVERKLEASQTAEFKLHIEIRRAVAAEQTSVNTE